MKKVLFVLALVVAYGVSIANVSVKTIATEKSELSIVVDSDIQSISVEEEEKDKKKKEEKKACCSSAKAESKSACTTKAKGEKPSTGCGEAQKKSCAASKKSCGEAKATTTTKSSCCGSKK